MLAPTSELVWFATIPPIRLFAAQPPGPEPKGNDGQPRWGSGDNQSRVVALSLMWMPDVVSQAVRRRQLAIMRDRNDEGFFQRNGKGWRILRGLQARRMRGGSGTRLVQRPTKATNYMRTTLAVIANQLNGDAVAVITSNHNNVATRCGCTCRLAQVLWCIGETHGDAHSIASSVLVVAVVTVRLHMHCAMM